MHEVLAADPDMENILIDSTVVRAYPLRCRHSQKRDGHQSQALGRSRGGFSTKIHICVDTLSDPLRFLVTDGQQQTNTQQAEA